MPESSSNILELLQASKYYGKSSRTWQKPLRLFFKLPEASKISLEISQAYKYYGKFSKTCQKPLRRL